MGRNDNRSHNQHENYGLQKYTQMDFVLQDMDQSKGVEYEEGL